MVAEYTNERNLVVKMTDFSEYLRKDYDAMSDEIDAEFRALSKEQALRIEVDNSLESVLKELESLQSQLPKEQMNALFEQCQKMLLTRWWGILDLQRWWLIVKMVANLQRQIILKMVI